MQFDPPIPIMIAARPQLEIALQEWLHPEFALTFCHTLQDAKQKIATRRFRLIFCALHFNENRPLDLLRYLRTLPAPGKTPFVVGVMMEGIVNAETVAAILKSLKVLGVDECIDLSRWLRFHGPKASGDELRRTFRRLIHGPLA
jgi:CheY-like chemotaxis protein